ncbi:MAG: hypothetical protein CVU47_01795 [Chloroflexi bacterium HGW-Chloroflexi-9]|nr:MAG: hypothetical protein CVU47_01795 [Chloroflexi bacterium HGW-Chloroflexi-9]
MRVLWLTREAPYPPRYGGDYLYSSRLIEALAAAGVDVHVLCSPGGGLGPDVQCREPSVTWKVVAPPPLRPAWRSLLTPLPNIAARQVAEAMRQRAMALVAQGGWDAVCLDHIGMGWLLPHLERARTGRRPLLVYIAHNHEKTVRAQLAREAPGGLPRRLALRLDAWKAGRLEDALVRRSDLVIANTEVDEALYRREHPGVAAVVVKPAYEGPVLDPLPPEAKPRRVVLVGSFGWLAKQLNLDAFLDEAAPRLAAAGVELVVAGAMPLDYERAVSARFPSVRLTGAGEDLTPHLREARAGVVPEHVGGGFKHKALQYVFCRVPILALSGSVAGTPLVPGRSILEYADMRALVDGILGVVDDAPRLTAVEAAAFEACRDGFRWADRGVTLRDAFARRLQEVPA